MTKQKRESARDVLINAAEHLFGTIGFDGVSTRQILDFAGQKNQSALQYHFGGRAGLIWAVLDARLSIVESGRQALMEKLPPRREESPEDLVEAVIRPLAEFVHDDERGSAFVQFIVQSVHRPDYDIHEVIGRGNYPALEEVWERMDWHLRHVPEKAKPFRKQLILSNAVGSVATWDATGKENVDVEDFIETATQATAAIIRLP